MSSSRHDRRSVGARRLLVLGCRDLLLTAIAISSALLLVGVVTVHHAFLFDFRGGLYDAGTAIIDGHDPYRASFLAHQAAIMHAGGVAAGETAANAFSIPVYPAPANLAILPLSLLPFWLAGALFTLLSVGATILGLRLLGVRDWRCIAIALVSWPSLNGLDLGAAGPLILLGAAVLWRWRERLWPPAIALTGIVVLKIFPWPLGVWLLVTRRYRTFALSVLIGAVVTFAAWAVIGFAGMAQYPEMLSNLSFIQEGRAVSLVAVLLAAGLPVTAADTVAIAAAAALLALAWRFVKRPEGDRQAFGLAVMAALTASPIVWEHYLLLLFVPIALISPRLSTIWLLPLCGPLSLTICLAFGTSAYQTTIRTAISWLTWEAVLVGWICWKRPGLSRTRPSSPCRPPGRRARSSVPA